VIPACSVKNIVQTALIFATSPHLHNTVFLHNKTIKCGPAQTLARILLQTNYLLSLRRKISAVQRWHFEPLRRFRGAEFFRLPFFIQ
jgi:hypothetical protein